jgi:ribosomal protein S18 acetylase RimI-like enzyme
LVQKLKSHYIELLTTDKLDALRDELISVYYAAFSEPPYHETETDAAQFGRSLLLHAQRAGFRGLIARDLASATIVGFAYGYSCLPGQWWHDTIASALPTELSEQWLTDSFELVELAVRPSAHGRGIGGRLHDQLLQGLPQATALLSVVQAATPAMHLYRQRGWVTLLSDFFYPGSNKASSVMGLDLK